MVWRVFYTPIPGLGDQSPDDFTKEDQSVHRIDASSVSGKDTYVRGLGEMTLFDDAGGYHVIIDNAQSWKAADFALFVKEASPRDDLDISLIFSGEDGVKKKLVKSVSPLITETIDSRVNFSSKAEVRKSIAQSAKRAGVLLDSEAAAGAADSVASYGDLVRLITHLALFEGAKVSLHTLSDSGALGSDSEPIYDGIEVLTLLAQGDGTKAIRAVQSCGDEGFRLSALLASHWRRMAAGKGLRPRDRSHLSNIGSDGVAKGLSIISNTQRELQLRSSSGSNPVFSRSDFSQDCIFRCVVELSLLDRRNQ